MAGLTTVDRIKSPSTSVDSVPKFLSKIYQLQLLHKETQTCRASDRTMPAKPAAVMNLQHT